MTLVKEVICHDYVKVANFIFVPEPTNAKFLIKIVVWILDSFDANLEFINNFTKYLKKSC